MAGAARYSDTKFESRRERLEERNRGYMSCDAEDKVL